MYLKLEVLRSAVASVKEACQLSCGTDEEDAESGRSRINRLQMYRKEIRVVRQNLDREHLKSRTLFKSIIRTWKNLKSLRRSQNYVNTPVQIRIIK